MTMGHHGRLVFNLIDQEMDGMKLVGQEMKWVIWYDREMDCSNRNGREMSWKWKMKNLSWKWKIRSIFINKMSLWRYLVGPGTRWIESKQELFEKSLYRPKKWKDKPTWIMIGPKSLCTSKMVYFQFIYYFIKFKTNRIKFGYIKQISNRIRIWFFINRLGFGLGFILIEDFAFFFLLYVTTRLPVRIQPLFNKNKLWLKQSSLRKLLFLVHV